MKLRGEVKVNMKVEGEDYVIVLSRKGGEGEGGVVAVVNPSFFIVLLFLFSQNHLHKTQRVSF